jgi:hypothetical protein
MTQRTFSLVTAVLFIWIALLHVIRLFLGWQVAIAGTVLPMWISWLGLVLAAFLAYEGLRLARTIKK